MPVTPVSPVMPAKPAPAVKAAAVATSVPVAKPPARNLVLARGASERAGDWLFRTRRGIGPAFITAFDTILGFLGASRRRVAVVVMPRWRAARTWFAASGIRGWRPTVPGLTMDMVVLRRRTGITPLHRFGIVILDHLRRLVELRPSDLKRVKSIRIARPIPGGRPGSR